MAIEGPPKNWLPTGLGLVDRAASIDHRAFTGVDVMRELARRRGKDEMEAQIKALVACNDPDPVLPCFIYAINDRVVFSQRKPEPIK